ncbi:hypothetical protein ACJX0J_013346, partial [Zea mays]
FANKLSCHATNEPTNFSEDSELLSVIKFVKTIFHATWGGFFAFISAPLHRHMLKNRSCHKSFLYLLNDETYWICDRQASITKISTPHVENFIKSLFEIHSLNSGAITDQHFLTKSLIIINLKRYVAEIVNIGRIQNYEILLFFYAFCFEC